jgi:hypothetical protein
MNKIKIFTSLQGMLQAWLLAILVCLAGPAQALVVGWTGTASVAVVGSTSVTTRSFTLTAREDFISTSDGNSHYAWGYARDIGFVMQYPGPTLIVNQGDVVKIKLKNTLPVPVSIVFPGQVDVTATDGSPGLLTREAPAVPRSTLPYPIGDGPTYSFVALEPGTYQYHSGTQADLQIEMGLVGALIVRPTGFATGDGAAHPNRKAYQQAGTQFDRETLFLLTEMDPAVHWTVYGQVQSGLPIAVDTSQIKPSMWFINGRNAPDTQLDDYVYWLPTQPYNALPRMHAGERLLMRVVNAGRDLHPFHHHGNHATAIARDGRVLSSNPSNLSQEPDISAPDFTVRSVPGQTMDLIYEWTGQGIGWDIYGSDSATQGHTCNGKALTTTVGDIAVQSPGFDAATHEDCTQHGKAIPVVIPSQLDIASGEHYGGSPFLGQTGTLPQGHPGLNTTGGYYHMLHSHNEKEVTTDDIFPGGMMTMLVIEPRGVDLDNQPDAGNGGGGGGGGADPTLLPSLALLDDFNRGDSNNLGANWSQSGTGNGVDIRVNANVAYANTSGQAIWTAPLFGAHQGAAFTFTTPNLNNSGLLLKASGASVASPQNYVLVRYEINNNVGRIRVYTTSNGGNSLNTRATFANQSFSNGDTLTATVDAAGLVRVWKNAVYINSVQLPTTGNDIWTLGTGRIGMSFGSNNRRVDNFHGGNLP